jgi:carboxymethylenebutenolidase
MPKAIATLQRVVDSKAMEDVGAAITHLKSQSNVKSDAIGVIGFCMGGRLTYLAAAHHAKDVKAAVPYYGGGITMGNPSPLSRTGEIKCPMYLFFGAKDQLIPMDQVGQINTELTTKKVPFQMKIYPDAGHGFFCDERGSYHEASAKDAWEKTKSFFAQHLK